MKHSTVLLCLLASSAGAPSLSFAQESAAARAQALTRGGIQALAACNDERIGYAENLMGDRLAAKLAVSPALTAQEKEIWQAEINALRAISPNNQKFQAPDPKDPRRFLLGLTPAEQNALGSMATRRQQEVQLDCEHKYGGMTAQNSPTRLKYEAELRAKFVTPVDVSTVALSALPSPVRKTREQERAEDQANVAKTNAARQESQRKAAAATAGFGANAAKPGKSAACQEEAKPLRLNTMADLMQTKLDGTTGLSAADRSAFEADIRSVRDAAKQGLTMPVPVDATNPMRAMTRLTQAEQMAMINTYTQALTAQLQACMAR